MRRAAVLVAMALLLAACGTSVPPVPAGQVDPRSTQAAAVIAAAPHMPTPPPATSEPPIPAVATPAAAPKPAPKRPARKPTPRPSPSYDCAEQDVSGWTDDQFAACSGH